MSSIRPGQRLARLAAAFSALPLVCLLAGATPAAAQSDPLAASFAAALANPTNIPAQLAYARAAEAAGKPEAAFPVYERVLALDPNNREAQAGLRRIRTTIQPTRRETWVEFGGAYETNPLRVPSGADPEFQLYGNLTGRYERTLGEQRWRTSAQLGGTWHAEQSALNYGYAGAVTGPLLNLGPNAVVHLAAGGGISSFSGRLFYTEAIGSIVGEAGFNGAVQTVRLRVGWRQFDPFWVSDSGFWADITGKFILPQTQPGSAFVLTPWARLSNVGGSFLTGNVIDPIVVTPGQFIDAGGQVQYLREIARGVSGGINFAADARQYSSDVVPLTTTPRRDFTISPGISIVLPDLIGQVADLRFRYNFILNNSNDDAHDFTDHYVTVGVGGKF